MNIFAQMNQPINRIASLILCTIVLLNGMSLYVVNRLTQNLHRQYFLHLIKNVPSSQCRIFFINKENISTNILTESLQEIEIGGKSFDVVSAQNSSQGVWIKCVEDRFETQLKLAASEHFRGKVPPIARLIVERYQNTFFESAQTIHMVFAFQILVFHPHTNIYQFDRLAELTPPPEGTKGIILSAA